MKSFRDVISLWPTCDAMAAELGARTQTVSKWWQRESIPPMWWRRIISAPLAREAGVTLDMLVSFVGTPRATRPPSASGEATHR